MHGYRLVTEFAPSDPFADLFHPDCLDFIVLAGTKDLPEESSTVSILNEQGPAICMQENI